MFETNRDKTKALTREDFDAEFKKHQEKSRAGAEKKFGGHGMVAGDLTAASAEELKIKTRLHTATHLLHTALRQVLGNEVKQAGSDITAERLRFDFSFSRKLTDEEIRKVEEMANTAVEKDYSVKFEEMSLDDAITKFAEADREYKVYAADRRELSAVLADYGHGRTPLEWGKTAKTLAGSSLRLEYP